jgi:hypothetical protein
MAMISVEKDSVTKVQGSTTADINKERSIGDDNLGALNISNSSYEFTPKKNKDSGMSFGHIKKEYGLFGICISTIFIILIAFALLTMIYLIITKGFNINIRIFPVRDSYTAQEFKAGLRRSFLLLSGLLLGICVLVCLIVNLTVRTRFIKHYLSKFNIFVYDIYVLAINFFLYLGVIYIFFSEVSKLHNSFVKWLSDGVITEAVKTDTINIFKYIIVVVVVIFMVINSFALIGIIHKKNRFVFEEEM